MSISKEDKTDLTDINQRFLNYVSKVRHLKNEEDVQIINQSISMLEEELKFLKTSYESQICQLKTTLDIIIAQKLDLEKELLSRKNNECHLNDRLTVESSKNSKLLHELSCLRSDISSSEQEIISLNLIIKQLKLEKSDIDSYCEKITRNSQENNAKAFKLEEQIRDYENQIVCLKQKIEFQDHFFSEKLDEMKSNQEDYLERMVSMDYKIQEANQRESQWPDILNRIQKTASEEFNKFKSETEAFFNERIEYLQQQLDSEISDNNRLKQTNENINEKLLSMRKKEAELNSTTESLQRKIDIMEKALISDKEESEKVIQSLQNKIKQLQQHITAEIDQAKNDKSLNNVSIRGEIEFIKRLLSEEEARLNIKSNYHYNDIMSPLKLNDNQLNENTNDNQGDTDDIKARTNMKFGCQSTVTVNSSSDQVNYHNIINTSEEEAEELNNNRYINNLSIDENPLFESDHHMESENKNNEYYENNPDMSYINEIGEIHESGDCENLHYWKDKREGTVVKSHTPVGPINHSENIVGPVRLISSTPLVTNERPPRPSSANIKGTRTKSYMSHQDSLNKDCLSRNSNNFTDSGIGQSPDYFDSLVKTNDKHLEEKPENMTDSVEISSLSSVKVFEVNKDGKYMKIWNSSDKDAEIGGYIIKQTRFGHPVSVFRFPDRVKFPANGTITIWSGSNDPSLHQPPTDFFSSQPLLWGSSPEFTTILCNSFGQALSWTSTQHRVNPDPYRAKTAAIISKDRKRVIPPKLPELIPSNISSANEQIYFIRDNMDSLSKPIHHPFTSTPKSIIHPCMEGFRGKTSGNDNSSFNRQTRQQNDSIPDPMIGQPYAGTNIQRMIGSARVMHHYIPPSILPSHSLNNRTPEVIFRSICEPPNAFQNPQSRLVSGIDQVQSMHNNLYSTPMYKTESRPSVN